MGNSIFLGRTGLLKINGVTVSEVVRFKIDNEKSVQGARICVEFDVEEFEVEVGEPDFTQEIPYSYIADDVIIKHTDTGQEEINELPK